MWLFNYCLSGRIMTGFAKGGLFAALLIICVTAVPAPRGHADPVPSPYLKWLDETRLILGETYFKLSGISSAVKSQIIVFENDAFVVSPYWAYPEFQKAHKEAIANLEHVEESVIGDHFLFAQDDPQASSKTFITFLAEDYIAAMQVAASYIEPLMIDEDQQPRISLEDYHDIRTWMHRGEIALNMALMKARSETTSELIEANIYSDFILQGASIALFSKYLVQSCYITAHHGGPEDEYVQYFKNAIEAYDESVNIRNQYADWIEKTYADRSDIRDAHVDILNRWDELLESTEYAMDKIAKTFTTRMSDRRAGEDVSIMVEGAFRLPDDQKIWDLQLAIAALPETLGRDAGLMPR